MKAEAISTGAICPTSTPVDLEKITTDVFHARCAARVLELLIFEADGDVNDANYVDMIAWCTQALQAYLRVIEGDVLAIQTGSDAS